MLRRKDSTVFQRLYSAEEHCVGITLFRKPKYFKQSRYKCMRTFLPMNHCGTRVFLSFPTIHLHLTSYYNTNCNLLNKPRDNWQITPLAVVSIFSLTLVSHSISAAARLESRVNLRGMVPHIEYPWAVSWLSKKPPRCLCWLATQLHLLSPCLAFHYECEVWVGLVAV